MSKQAPALFSLEEGMENRLILIVAPRWEETIAWLIDGMRQLQQMDHTRFAWVALCPEDEAPFRFWSDLLEALQSVDGQLIDQLALKPDINLPFCLNESIEDLINILADEDGQFFLVFEGYHLIRTQEIHFAIQYLLDYLPDTTHLVIISQADPPLKLSRLRVRRQMIEIRVGES